MIYVMSDLHGCYEKYKEMLNKIHFADSDKLYIIGDVVDRGERPIDILLDMMERPNVFPIMGNHELMALDILKTLSVEITEENFNTHIDEALMNNLLDYQLNGGESTIRQFQEKSIEERQAILDYIEDEFVAYEIVKLNGNKFLLVHSGLGNFANNKALDAYSLEELTYIRLDYSKRYFNADNIFIVGGHTPTLEITGEAKIYKANNNICIDCGAAFGGKLACLCLDTMEEFYVE